MAGNKGFTNRAKSGQKALPARLKRAKAETPADRAKSGRGRQKRQWRFTGDLRAERGTETLAGLLAGIVPPKPFPG